LEVGRKFVRAKKDKEYMTEPETYEIISTILEKRQLIDRYGKPYLILRLASGEGVFVFPRIIEEAQ
jgi:hypothetical protein